MDDCEKVMRDNWVLNVGEIFDRLLLNLRKCSLNLLRWSRALLLNNKVEIEKLMKLG